MSSQIIRYTGSFRFETRAQLDRALVHARSRIDEDAELAALEGGWQRCFVIGDPATLRVTLALSSVDQHRVAAAEIFALLSRESLEGSVIATINDVPIEYYTVEPWVVDVERDATPAVMVTTSGRDEYHDPRDRR